MREFYQCAKLSIAHKAGVESRFGHHNQTTLERFEPARQIGQAGEEESGAIHSDRLSPCQWMSQLPCPSGIQLVNVDTTTIGGIDRARDLGLVPSGLANLIFTDRLKYAAIELFDEAHSGRAIALFRHRESIDRSGESLTTYKSSLLTSFSSRRALGLSVLLPQAGDVGAWLPTELG